MKKKFLIVFFALVATSIISLAGFVLWFNTELKAPSNDPSKKQILITKGSSADKIAGVLFENKIIRNEFVFKLYVRLNNLQGSLPPGQFAIPQNLSVSEVITLLKKGPNEVWVTIPEGLRREQIPSRFTNALNLNADAALTFTNEFLQLSKNNEGYLFPDTYLVPIDITPAKAVSLLTNTFNKQFGNSFAGSKSELQRVVIIASIIERETRNDSEKADISGVFQNRLSIGMPLQIDATVQYALATINCKSNICSNWWPTVYIDDYKLKNPFNTYTISGLPPLPISNPGLASLKAAQNPSVHNYFYYIHDKSGNIHLAQTYNEHTSNVQKYIR